MSDANREEDGFFAAISAAPEDIEPRAVYADWLEERGDVRGEYLRVACRIEELKRELRRRTEQLDALTDRVDGYWARRVTFGWQVQLRSYTCSKLDIIRTIRSVLPLRLAEVKRLVESAPILLGGELSRGDANELAKRINANGGVARVVAPTEYPPPS